MNNLHDKRLQLDNLYGLAITTLLLLFSSGLFALTIQSMCLKLHLNVAVRFPMEDSDEIEPCCGLRMILIQAIFGRTLAP